MRYYFGWMEENKIVRPVPEEENLYIFVERFYREKFLPYKFKPHTDIKQMRYYFGWMEENKIVRPVPEEENLYIFVERYRLFLFSQKMCCLPGMMTSHRGVWQSL